MPNTTFDQVVAEIQKVPGYADFPAEPTFAQIQADAQDAPLVYLLATSVGGLALIAYGDDVQPLWLDDLTDATVHEWLRRPADDPKLGGWLGAYPSWLVEWTNKLSMPGLRSSTTLWRGSTQAGGWLRSAPAKPASSARTCPTRLSCCPARCSRRG